jgi:peptide deformylase
MEDNVIKNVDALRQKSTDVELAEEAKDIIQKLEDALKHIDHGIGLAAIQIGIPKKVGVIKAPPGKRYKFIHLINPVVESKEDEFVFFNEGCLSFPNLFRNTKRYRHYTIKHKRISEEGELEDETLYFYYEDGDHNSDGLSAIAVQHEMDHFEGELIIDSEVDPNLKPQPITSNKKIGRNEPCSCGSGKKYKKCCGK